MRRWWPANLSAARSRLRIQGQFRGQLGGPLGIDGEGHVVGFPRLAP